MSTVAAASGNHTCFFCDDPSHSLWNCPKSVEDRTVAVKQKSACFNCLRTGHPVYRCTSISRCRHCGRKHHSTIHTPPNEADGRQGAVSAAVISSEVTVTKASISNHTCASEVSLPVVSVEVQGERIHAARCLLDTGSTTTFISESLANTIKAPLVKHINLELLTFATSNRQIVQARVVRCQMRSIDNQLMSFEPIVLSNLGVKQEPPSLQLPCVQELLQQHGVELSDSASHPSNNNEIDILIGSDILPTVTTGRSIVLDGGAVAMETRFGWALQGPIRPNQSSKAVVSYLKAAKLTLEEKVSAFWEIEEIAKPHEDVQTDPFRKLINFKGGRYEVPLLWKGVQRPTNNKNLAARQYAAQKVRAERNDTWKPYQELIEEYREFGAIEDDPLDSCDGYYLPHHAVSRPSSDTHPMRIVFNASSKQGNEGLSLNGCLDSGPNVLPHVSDILMKFRRGAHPLTGDLQKAFFTISVVPSDRQYLRLIWDPPQRMSRVPFGVNCSPYLLQATILHHLKLCVEKGELSVEMFLLISRALYMMIRFSLHVKQSRNSRIKPLPHSVRQE